MLHDPMYDPSKNGYLGALLERNKFDWRAFDPEPFINPVTREESGVIILPQDRRQGLVLLLAPGKSTGIARHDDRFDGTITYLGPAYPFLDTVLQLRYTFQNNFSLARDTSVGDVNCDCLFEKPFKTRTERGKLLHGFRAADKPALDLPAVIVIRK